MPELPEVETVRRGLNQRTLNQEIVGGDVLLSRTIAHPPLPIAFLAGLQGTAIAQWHRRGKYLLAELYQISSPPGQAQSAGWLGVHLRMTGQLLWLHQEEPLQKHCRVRLFLAGQQELRFVDQRTFGQMWWVPSGTQPEVVMTGLQRLGPEPLSADFSAEYLATRLRDRHRPIKNALLDQMLVAGIGNIYADEALFLSKIKPKTLCSALKSRQVTALYAAIVRVLQDSIDARGTSFSNFRDVEGVNGNYGGVAWVYDRKGEPCRTCDTPIERLKLAGRSAHFCPKCQR
ncbi:DNA-formamidopyrimidine glycosylase [Leptolyngbya sp. FACHB-541]|uniref:DNA-formamidopyrimidine glycosylase n=1 Tax=Leptolyngbya sp. FACHB-541 TaxID=2692810 RepID=UPI0016853B33|nr:DNA-formamidopyrimidine glycosylase [Leptolyngbya sp. FACHB-541]